MAATVELHVTAAMTDARVVCGAERDGRVRCVSVSGFAACGIVVVIEQELCFKEVQDSFAIITAKSHRPR